MRLRVHALLWVVLPLFLSARPVERMEAAPLVNWIVGLQETRPESRGAVTMHPEPSFYLEGQGYRHVVPYFSNLAVAALLDAEPSKRSRLVGELWIDWFLERLGPEGVPVEHWVGMEDGLELTCPQALPTRPAVARCDAIDATDSSASTFLLVLEAYRLAGGSEVFLRQREATIREVAETLLDLQKADGLTVARESYRVKYLMDNAETVAGLRAMASLERAVFGGDPGPVAEASSRAANGLASLQDGEVGLSAWAKMPNGTLEAAHMDRWYADVVSQVWPLVFGVTASPDGYRQLDAAWDGTSNPDWTQHRDASGFSWPVLGLAAYRAGDLEAAQRQAEILWQRYVIQGAAGPFTIADAGWLLRTVVALDEG